MAKIIEGREQSGFPLSVGTGLAMETLISPVETVVDDSRKYDKLDDFSVYDYCLINIATLMRNIYSAVPSDDVRRYDIADYSATLDHEIDYIKDICAEHGISVKFYFNSYKYYLDTYKDSTRTPSTDKQREEARVTEGAMKLTMKKHPEIHTFSHLIRFDSGDRVLLISHYPVDLLSFGKFRKLDLLESNTGTIKTRKDYNSKYFPVPNMDMSILPFFEHLLVMFGDKVMFRPKPIKKRVELYNTMKKLKVTPFTSEFGLINKL